MPYELPTAYQTFIAKSRYARWLEDKMRRETWDETINRYLDFFFKKNKLTANAFSKLPDGGASLRQLLEYNIANLKAMPSMRCLMTAGEALERDNVAAFNCAYVAVDDVKVFSETMYILMCFHPDTEIQTRLGAKKISEITVDDEVLSLNQNTGEFVYIRPETVLCNPTNNSSKVRVTFEDGSTVDCTEDHKFLTSNRGWVEAQNLTEHDDIVNADTKR